MQFEALTKQINDFLKIAGVKDYCPNGLQVTRQNQEFKKIALAVTASLEIIEQAGKIRADALIVHHGLFWNNDPLPLTGIKYRRVQALLQNDLALLAYHLPLDIHPEIGNNIELGKLLGLSVTQWLKPDGQLPLVAMGYLQTPQTFAEFAQQCEQKFGRLPLVVAGGVHPVRKVAWCSGAAQDFIEIAKQHDADLYLSGEISERTYYQAQELGIHYLACGHHATERYGIQALGAWLQKSFGLAVEFIDADNPV